MAHDAKSDSITDCASGCSRYVSFVHREAAYIVTEDMVRHVTVR